jgi:hypothetical protein
MSSDGPAGSAPWWRDRRLLWGLVPLVVVVVLLVVWVAGGDDGSDPGAAEPADGEPTAEVITPSPGVDASGSPIPSARPGQTAPAPAKTAKGSESPGAVRTALRAPAELGNGVVVGVSRVEAVRGEAQGPGETAGPALRFTLRVANQSQERVDLSATAVTAYSGADDEPAGDLSGPDAEPFSGTLAAGESARGVYVFQVPPDQRDRVRLDFSYGAEAPRAVFRGAAP